MEAFWGVVIIAGPALLLAALAWGWARNRRISRADEARSDRGTHRLREDLADEQDRRADL